MVNVKRNQDQKISLQKKSRNKNRQSKRKSSYMTAKRCKQVLQEKIKQTTKEYKLGQFSSRKPPVAVAYSMINKKYPNCKKVFSRRRRT